MKYTLLSAAFCLFFASFAFAQTKEINIIPKPKSVKFGDGNFSLNKSTTIVALGDNGRKMAGLLNETLKKNFGFGLKIQNSLTAKNHILLGSINFGPSLGGDNGGYLLTIEPGRVTILGSYSGLFYGLQSLIQLLPTTYVKQVEISAVTIDDSPRFGYRGMHLDVARHFMPVSFVKKFIDLMSQYKFNYFHWHLTEDQGWRIEIKKYPKLTEIGSRRPETVKERNLTPYIGDGIPHGGFYTQEQIREVVAYAKERYITVIPEIELPGHASAALAAYPQFGCKTDYQYKVQTTWGIFKEVYCPTDETFKFLEDVLDETIALFPDSPYIHIGGDEVLKDHWKESAFVQELKKRENLKDEHEVQSYFVRRIEKYINSKGKKMIGWDEILEGGLAPNATVMSWRGMKGGIEAAKSKHEVIMTPTDFVYFDYGQGDPAYEPLNIGSYVPLEKVYSFDPVPKELNAEEAKYIIGGQANVWTEYLKTPSAVEYMSFPRMLALSEVLWSRQETRNFADFQKRLNAVLPRLDKQNVNYRIPEPVGLVNAIFPIGNKGLETIHLVGLRPPIPGSKILYTLDGSVPNELSKPWDGPLKLTLKPEDIKELKTIVVLPSGRKSAVYSAIFLRRDTLVPVELTETKPGVTFDLVQPSADFPEDPPSQKGETRSIFLTQFEKQIDLRKSFGVQFEGYFRATVDGVYEFQVDSTWDTTLVLGGKIMIDDAGDAMRKMRSAIVPLQAGLHKISLRYNHRGGDAHFRFRYGIKGQGLRQAGGGEFVHQ